MGIAFDWAERLRGIRLVEGDESASHVLWLLIHARVYVDEQGSGFQALSELEQRIWRVGCFVGDVMNGGFDQFYFNSAGQYANELPLDLEALGSRKMRSLLERANFLLKKNKPVPIDRTERQDALESISPSKRKSRNAFAALDRELYQLPSEDFPSWLDYALARSEALVYSESEFGAVLQKQPHLLFPLDRAASARFDIDARTIRVELGAVARHIPLGDLSMLSIVKKPAEAGASGLFYRLQLTDEVVDIPFFAKGESSRGTIIWFLDAMKSHPLSGAVAALAESRREGALAPIVLWENKPGARYLD